MEKRKNYYIFLLILMLAVIFLFFRWLYTGNAAETMSQDFGQEKGKEKITQTIYIQFINHAIPAAKVSYEEKYGRTVPDFFSSVISYITDGMYTDVRNPLTYINVAFSAFSMGASNASVMGSDQNKTATINGLPDVKNFVDAPAGAVYFNEEDEYNSEGYDSINVIPADEPNPEDAIIEENIPEPDRLALEKKSPQILIYHTHATESYMPNIAENYHTQNERYNVLNVGNAMSKVLQSKYKYRVIHDKTYHDQQSYVYSYTNSNLTIKKNIKEYPSVKVILDLHRDAFDVSNGGKNQKKSEYTTTINGKKAARVMLVIGKGNPNYAELEKYAVYIKKKMEKLYPGLFLKIDRKPKSKYNEYYSNYSMLIEVGCMLNTNEEARYSGELMGNVIGEVLKDLKE